MTNGFKPPEWRYIVGGRVHASSIQTAVEWTLDTVRSGSSRTACFSTVHMLMEAYDSDEFRTVLNNIDLVNPDGRPLMWTLQMMGARDARQATGTASSGEICAMAAREQIPVGFYGASQKTLDLLQVNLKQKYPGLNIAYAYSPPFRPMSSEEDARVVQDIVDSGTRILFVGLGCPKQERWAEAHKGRIPGAILAVGAAFDFHAGSLMRAPDLLQKLGLEWLFRLVVEPRRLWKRYLYNNPRYMWLVALQMLGLRDYKDRIERAKKI